MIHKIILSGSIFVDNNNAVSLNGGSTKFKKYPSSEFLDSVVIGKA